MSELRCIQGYVDEETQKKMATFSVLESEYESYGILCDPVIYTKDCGSCKCVHVLRVKLYHKESEQHPFLMELLVGKNDTVEFVKGMCEVTLNYEYSEAK